MISICLCFTTTVSSQRRLQFPSAFMRLLARHAGDGANDSSVRLLAGIIGHAQFVLGEKTRRGRILDGVHVDQSSDLGATLGLTIVIGRPIVGIGLPKLI